jgi:cobalt-zinc-cadmium efflux system protein
MAGLLIARARSRRLASALAANAALVVGESVAGWLGHSTALLADAGHNLTDVAVIATALGALRWSLRPRSDQRSYGNHRATILAALFNASALTIVTLSVVALCVDRLLRPTVPHAGVLTAVAAAALVVNGVAALFLFERTPDLNLRSTFLHQAGDVASAGLALVAGVVVFVAGPQSALADPAAGLAVSILIAVQAVRLLRTSVEILLESAPADVDVGAVRSAIAREFGVSEVHDLHVWSLSSELRVLSAHLVLVDHPTLEEAQAVAEKVRTSIARSFGVVHSTFELECERCSEADDPCQVAVLTHVGAREPRTRRSPE